MAKGFTLIVLLVVVMIIAVLFYGGSYFAKKNNNETKTQLNTPQAQIEVLNKAKVDINNINQALQKNNKEINNLASTTK